MQLGIPDGLMMNSKLFYCNRTTVELENMIHTFGNYLKIENLNNRILLSNVCTASNGNTM